MTNRYQGLVDCASYAKLAEYREQLRACERISLLKAPLYSEPLVTSPAPRHPVWAAARHFLGACIAGYPNFRVHRRREA